MGKVYYNPEIKNVLDSFLLKIPIVLPGKVFGHPGYYVNKKLFACVYEDAVGLKVPFELANEMAGKEGFSYFIPMGRRKMKGWIQINREHAEDYISDSEIFQKSIDYVASLEDK